MQKSAPAVLKSGLSSGIRKEKTSGFAPLFACPSCIFFKNPSLPQKLQVFLRFAVGFDRNDRMKL